MSDLKNKLLAEVNKVKRYEESSMEGGGVHECGDGPFVRVSHVRNAIKRVLDRTQPEATAPAQDLSAAILALPLPEMEYIGSGGNLGYTEVKMRDLLKAAAALASSTNALSAGDRVDAGLSKYLRHLPDCGSWVKEVDTYDENDMWSGTTKVSRPCTCGLDALLQSQKGSQP